MHTFIPSLILPAGPLAGMYTLHHTHHVLLLLSSNKSSHDNPGETGVPLCGPTITATIRHEVIGAGLRVVVTQVSSNGQVLARSQSPLHTISPFPSPHSCYLGFPNEHQKLGLPNLLSVMHLSGGVEEAGQVGAAAPLVASPIVCRTLHPLPNRPC